MAEAPSTSSRSEIVSLCGENKELGALRVETHISCDVIGDGGRDLEGGGAGAREHVGRRA